MSGDVEEIKSHQYKAEETQHEDDRPVLQNHVDVDGRHTEGNQIIGGAAADAGHDALVNIAVEFDELEKGEQRDANEEGNAVNRNRHLRE